MSLLLLAVVFLLVGVGPSRSAELHEAHRTGAAAQLSLEWLMMAAASASGRSLSPPHKQGRNYVYPELSCPEAPQPVPLPPNWNATLAGVFADVEAYLNSYVTSNQTVGLAAAVVYDQEVVWKRGFGVSDKVSRQPVSTENLFRIASITKVFTDLMLLQLRDKGVLSLDDEVGKLVPEFQEALQQMFPTKRGITWRQLGSHMSGLPRSSPCVGLWGDCNITTAEALRRMRDQMTIQPSEMRPAYSNLGIALIGRLLEKVVGQSYEDYVVQNILRPLNMSDSGFDYTPDVVSRMTTGYYDFTDIPAPLFPLGWEAPAGQMYSSVGDLCKLMSLVFRDNYTAGSIPSQILDGQTLREWILPVYDSSVAQDEIIMMGMPWESTLYLGDSMPNYWQKGKDGAAFGYTSIILMVPQMKLGLVVLMNGGILSPAVEAGYGVNQKLIPAFDALLRSIQPPPQLPPYPEGLIGVYYLNSTYHIPSLYLGVYVSIDLANDVNGNVRLFMSVNTSSTDRLLFVPMEYHPAFNPSSVMMKNQVVMQAALTPAQASSCRTVLGGQNQLIVFYTAPGSPKAYALSLPGVFYGLYLTRA